MWGVDGRDGVVRRGFQRKNERNESFQCGVVAEIPLNL